MSGTRTRFKHVCGYLLAGGGIILSHSVFANTGNWFLNINSGLGTSEIGSNSTLTLYNTSSPVQTNTYTPNKAYRFAGSLGVGGGYRFHLPRNMQFLLGASASWVGGTSEGVVHPMVNVASDFDTLNYHYDADSYILMLEPSIVCNTASNWQPFVGFGMGVSWNELSHYYETVPSGSTATPGPLAFRHRITTAFAYAPSVGVIHPLNKNTSIELSYRYINVGNAHLNTLENQETAQRIQSGDIGTHLFTFGLIFS